jgi:hypothetical protein
MSVFQMAVGCTEGSPHIIGGLHCCIQITHGRVGFFHTGKICLINKKLLASYVKLVHI